MLLGQCGTGEEDTGHSIIVTDLAEAVELMAENIRLNGATRCSAAELAWGVTDVGSAFDAPFDVVLMAEVAYLPETYSALAATVAALSGPQTVVLHGYTPRDACRSDLLFAELSAHGFSHEELVGSSAVRDSSHKPHMHSNTNCTNSVHELVSHSSTQGRAARAVAAADRADGGGQYHGMYVASIHRRPQQQHRTALAAMRCLRAPAMERLNGAPVSQVSAKAALKKAVCVPVWARGSSACLCAYVSASARVGVFLRLCVCVSLRLRACLAHNKGNPWH